MDEIEKPEEALASYKHTLVKLGTSKKISNYLESSVDETKQLKSNLDSQLQVLKLNAPKAQNELTITKEGVNDRRSIYKNEVFKYQDHHQDLAYSRQTNDLFMDRAKILNSVCDPDIKETQESIKTIFPNLGPQSFGNLSYMSNLEILNISIKSIKSQDYRRADNLINYISKLDVVDQLGRSVLTYSLEADSDALATKILHKRPYINCNLKDSDGKVALNYAAEFLSLNFSNIHIISEILGRTENPNNIPSQDKTLDTDSPSLESYAPLTMLMHRYETIRSEDVDSKSAVSSRDFENIFRGLVEAFIDKMPDIIASSSLDNFSLLLAGCTQVDTCPLDANYVTYGDDDFK